MKKLLSDIMVELHVPSFEIAKIFYQDLGFKVVWERKPNERKGYLVMRNKYSILNFYCGNEHVYEHSFFSKFSKDTSRGYGVEIIIPIDGIEDYYKKLKQKYSDKIVKEINTKFDCPDFRMTDPFGYYLRFVERYDWVNGRDSKGNTIKND